MMREVNIIEYFIPIQTAEQVAEVNREYGTDYKSTDEHIDILIHKILDAIEAAGDVGGWYLGDGIRVRVEVEHKPEDK